VTLKLASVASKGDVGKLGAFEKVAEIFAQPTFRNFELKRKKFNFKIFRSFFVQLGYSMITVTDQKSSFIPIIIIKTKARVFIQEMMA